MEYYFDHNRILQNNRYLSEIRWYKGYLKIAAIDNENYPVRKIVPLSTEKCFFESIWVVVVVFSPIRDMIKKIEVYSESLSIIYDLLNDFMFTTEKNNIENYEETRKCFLNIFTVRKRGIFLLNLWQYWMILILQSKNPIFQM